MRRLVAPAVALACGAALACCTAVSMWPAGAASAAAPPDGGSATPLLIVPEGCTAPPVASVVFVGRVVEKDFRSARYRVEQVRAGSVAGHEQNDLVDIRYDNDVEFLDVGGEYLVGAVPQGVDLALGSKVRATEPLLGGNAIVGLTEKSSQCPTIEDPVRTLHLDGSEIDAGMLDGLSHDKGAIARAIGEPLLAAFGIVMALALVRWALTLIFAAYRRAAESLIGPVLPPE